jgi:hypothetical protein
MRPTNILIVALLLAGAVPACADDTRWSAEFLLGAAWNATTPVKITQAGQPDLEFDADFRTDPFEQPLYWALRFNHHRQGRIWSLELHHHKLILKNPPPEVKDFSITHGTNIVSLQHAWLRPRWRYLVLAGVVVAHPENTVRGLKLPEDEVGYQLTGPALGAGVGAHLALTSWLDLNGEARVTVAWIRVDVVDGRASFTNLAFHLLLGPRVRF